MPGPLSVTVIRNLLAWLGATASPLETTSSLTLTSGKIPASSQASKALSTASLTHVRRALPRIIKTEEMPVLREKFRNGDFRCRAHFHRRHLLRRFFGRALSETAGSTVADRES